MICVTMTVKMMRSRTAAPAPSMMPQKRWRGGSVRQASAITTALSPDSRMLIQMICPTATQNGRLHEIVPDALPPVTPRFSELCRADRLSRSPLLRGRMARSPEKLRNTVTRVVAGCAPPV